MNHVEDAERMTGYIVEPYLSQDHTFAFRAVERNGDIVATAGADDEKEALKALVEEVYKIHSEMVRRRQCYACLDCGGLKPLQIHHKTYRSQGGTHRLEELIAICAVCHERRHKKGTDKKNGIQAT